MMYPLAAQEILYIWEQGLHQHPVERALTILRVALPTVVSEELLMLSIGQRDTYLLALREATFGPELAGFAECPACRERLEFPLDMADIPPLPDIQAGEEAQQVTVDGYELHFRLPDSRDLIAIARQHDIAEARHMLVQRCIVQAAHDGTALPASKLPDKVVEGLAEHLACRDPQAEIWINLSCPACGHQWAVLFDIVSFFWSQLCGQARRLLRDVHTLARAYGWREADILSLSAARRQCYLEMVT